MFYRKKRKQSGTDLQAVQSCVGLKERGSLSLLTVKIASLPTMTYSHEFSTSPTTLSSPPSYTQQLFKWSTIGYIQCRYECLKTRMNKKKNCYRGHGTIFHGVISNNIAHSSRCVAFPGLCGAGFQSNVTPALMFLNPPSCWQPSMQHETFSSKTQFIFFLGQNQGGCILKWKLKGRK